MANSNSRAQWSSHWIFIMAATGSAVGLGNIWKFPYIMGQNGGGAFVLIYLVCIFLIAMPILIAEIILGRRGQANPITSIQHLAAESQQKKAWQCFAWMGVTCGIIILSFYSVVAGWIIAYIGEMSNSNLRTLPNEDISAKFGTLLSDPKRMLIWHSVFMVLTTSVVALGIKKGLEKATKILMPALLFMLLALFIYSVTSAEFAKGAAFMLNADFTKINLSVVLSALGHSFFTLSLGMGTIMAYGSYLSKKTSILRVSLYIVIADTLIAILAGLIIFPIVFSIGLEPSAGPGLVFSTLPTAFAQMPAGSMWGTLFFILLLFAAWTSAISMIEPAVAYCSEKTRLTRKSSAILIGGIIWGLGILTVFSFNTWAFSFEFLGTQKNAGFFDIFDILTSNFMLPLGGALIAIFTGWVVKKQYTQEELASSHTLFSIWLFLIKFVSPIAVIIILIYAII